jgi:hypothetical protein
MAKNTNICGHYRLFMPQDARQSMSLSGRLGKFHLPNIDDDIGTDVGQTIKLFTQPAQERNSK